MTEPTETKSISEGMLEGMRIPCPKCHEPMMMSASRCPNCQTEFSKEEVKASIHSKGTDGRSCMGLILIVGILGLIAYSLIPNSDTAHDKAELDLSDISSGEEYVLKDTAKELVAAQLRDPDSAQFSNLQVYPETADKPVITCGYVNSRNGFGGMTGPQRFISGGTIMIEENFTPSQMEIAWSRFCK